jgi:hypothetical protein
LILIFIKKTKESQEEPRSFLKRKGEGFTILALTDIASWQKLNLETPPLPERGTCQILASQERVD